MRFLAMLLSSRRPASLLLFCTLTIAPYGFLQQPDQNSPNIRVSVDRVNVGVVVTNSRGQFVEGLHREDFHIFDNSVEQPVTDFLSIDEPGQVLLLIEAGPAVYFLEGSHLRAVHALLEGLSPGDRIALVRYDQTAEAVLDFTPDKRAAAGSLDQLRFNVGFGQLNLASSVDKVLDWLAKIPGKKSLVLLSTGVDTSPSGAVQTLLPRLKSSDVRVLAISLSVGLRTPQPAQPPQNKSQKKTPSAPDKAQATAEVLAQADQELKAIAEASGGRSYFPTSTKDFSDVFAEIAQLIRHEYSLGFIPPAHDGKIHFIDVRISTAADSASSRVDHRQAYVAPQ
ncbi:MAG TPA: VWA domain-containing protein [Candidatus Acidoferrum sp.]|nr:VWA domain-containing protein [Candidatus Acidoferrum sp.]